MASVTGKKARRQIERKSRRINAINRKRQQRRKQWKGRRLTTEEKKIRSVKLKKRREEKRKQKQLNTENANIRMISKVLELCFASDELTSIAKASRFIRRKTAQITAIAFIYTMSFGFFGNGAIALAYLTAGLGKNFKIVITIQGLSKRINRKESVSFLKVVLSHLIGGQMRLGFKNKYEQIFSMFSEVVLEDSSQLSLNEHLTSNFEGSGGGASQSSIKLNFIYDIKNFIVLGIKKTSGIVSDNANCLEILKYIKPTMLIIRDLGFFSLGALKKIQMADAYYLSRLSQGVNVYLKQDDKEPLNIPEFLERERKKGNKSVDVVVYLGKTKEIKTRLIAESVPQSVVKKRTARYKKEYRKEPSEFYVAWSGFSIFITNIPEDIFSGKLIVCLYKIRWQIELVFKNFKSNLEIDVLKGTNKHRIDCLIYGRLIVLLSVFIIHRYAAHIAGSKEVSGDKLTKWLRCDDRLREAIIKHSLKELLEQLVMDLDLVCKQRRTKRTSMKQFEDLLILEKEIMEENLSYACA